MWFKEIIKNGFDNEESMLVHRYKASKIVFLFVCLIFFLSFFLVWAGFYRSFFLWIFSSLYILILITLDIYIYMFFLKTYIWKIKWAYKFFLLFFLSLFTIWLLFPIIVEWWLLWFYNNYLFDFMIDVKETFFATIEDIKNMLP